MIKYLGSKKKLVPFIVEKMGALEDVKHVVDLFSGTSRVGHALKAKGYRVYSNDYNKYAYTIARCYVEADSSLIPQVTAEVEMLNNIEGRAGWFTKTYCEDSRFFQPKNGERIDSIRSEIENSYSGIMKDVLLTSLMEAADRVDSTCGIQMAYIKKWSSRSFKDLELRVPDLLPPSLHGKGKAFLGDSNEFVKNHKADVFYIDPPYNQHSYLGNYHIWETLVSWDTPETYGKAKKRVECQERKSSYNSKRAHKETFTDLIGNLDARYAIVSFSDEAYMSREELEETLSTRGTFHVYEYDYKRYVGAQIGIYSPEGEKVGKEGKRRNTVRLFVLEISQ